jgi:drug/metabolite transporter (DMT)-like permease
MQSNRTHVHWRVHAALLVVQASFGGFSVFGKYVLGTLPPLALAGLRMSFAMPILVLLSLRRDRSVPPRTEMPRLALLGLLGVCLNQMLFIFGLQRTTAISATILITSIPVFTLLVGALLRFDRIDVRGAIGVAVAVCGALVMLDPSNLTFHGSAFTGNLLIVLNCLSYSFFLVLARPMLTRLSPSTVVAWSFVFGGAFTILASLPSMIAVPYQALPVMTWVGIGYIVIFATVLSYSLNTWAIRQSSPGLVAAYTTLQPVVAALLATIFLGETAGWREAAGFLLIVAGLAVISKKSVRSDDESHPGHNEGSTQENPSAAA